MDDQDSLCKICEASRRKYVCPKCGIPYCSLKCYQNLEKHFKCSEIFYRECVEEQVREERERDPDKSSKMGEILQRFREEYNREDLLNVSQSDDEELDSDDDEPLCKRMEGVNLDDSDQVWDSLTLEERENFKSFVQKSEAEDAIPEWTPWWTLPIKKIVVEEITEGEVLSTPTEMASFSNIAKLHPNQPDIYESIPSMSSLTQITPNDSVKLGLTNVVGSYVWTARLFSGEFVEATNQAEVAFAFVSLSSFLSDDKAFSSFREAVTDVWVNASKMPDFLDGGPGLQASLERDVYLILTSGLKGPLPLFSTNNSLSLSKAYVLSTISECHKLLSAVVKDSRKRVAEKKMGVVKNPIKLTNEKDSASFGKVFPTNSNHKLELKISSKALRKLHYLLAFANEFDFF